MFKRRFRRRPGRLLNILCTFNLRPVSTGHCSFHWTVFAVFIVVFFVIFHWNVFPQLVCHSWAYSQVFLRSLVTTIVKTYDWENVRSGKHRREKCLVRRSPSGKCPVGQLSVKELPYGKVSGWYLFMRKRQWENCTDANLSVKLSQRNCCKEL